MTQRLHISPWAAVALAALVAAFCGNALAGIEAKESARPFTASKAKRLFNKLIARRAPRLSVRRATRANTAASATSATSAATAASATRAEDANTVGGLQVKELFFAAPANTEAVEIFSAGGLSINVGCPANVGNGPELSATPTEAPQGALKFVGNGFSPGNPIGIDQYQLNAGDPAIDLDNGEDRGAAHLSFLREDGVTVNGIISWDDGVRAANDLCGVGGVLTVG